MLYLCITWNAFGPQTAAAKACCSKGCQKVHGPSSGNKSQITVLSCSNAVGSVLLPMVIF